MDDRVSDLLAQSRVPEARKVAVASARWRHLLAPPAVETKPGSGRGDFAENMRWLQEHKSSHGGQWVALRDGALVEAAQQLSALYASLKLAGRLRDVLVARVDP